MEISVHWLALLGETCPLKLVASGRVLRVDEAVVAFKIEQYEFRTRGARFKNRLQALVIITPLQNRNRPAHRCWGVPITIFDSDTVSRDRRGEPQAALMAALSQVWKAGAWPRRAGRKLSVGITSYPRWTFRFHSTGTRPESEIAEQIRIALESEL